MLLRTQTLFDAKPEVGWRWHYIERQAGRSAILPQDFNQLAAALKDLIHCCITKMSTFAPHATSCKPQPQRYRKNSGCVLHKSNAYCHFAICTVSCSNRWVVMCIRCMQQNCDPQVLSHRQGPVPLPQRCKFQALWPVESRDHYAVVCQVGTGWVSNPGTCGLVAHLILHWYWIF